MSMAWVWAFRRINRNINKGGIGARINNRYALVPAEAIACSIQRCHRVSVVRGRQKQDTESAII